MTLKPEQLAKLGSTAEAATPGHWDAVVLGSEGYDVRAPNPDSPIRRLRIARCGYEKWEVDRANAEFIAAWNPETAKAMLRMLYELEGQVRKVTCSVCDELILPNEDALESDSGPAHRDCLVGGE